MSRYIPEDIRRIVAARADFCCEYCKMPEEHAFFTFHLDHIMSIKHGEQTTLENLAYACAYCNRNKGSDLASVLLPDNLVVRCYNPRTDLWNEHFRWEAALIRPLTNIGIVTAKIFGFNDADRLSERQILMDSDRF
jgi:hypothetical protein